MQQKFKDAASLIQQNLDNLPKGKTDQKKVEARAYKLLSDVNIGRQNLSIAQDHATTSLNLYTELNEAKGRSQALYNLGIILIMQKTGLDKAVDYFLECLAYYETIGDPAGQAQVLLQLASAQRELQNFEVAFNSLYQAEKIGQKIGDLTILISAKILLGLAHLASGNKIAACQDWQTAKKLVGEQLPYLQVQIHTLIKQNC